MDKEKQNIGTLVATNVLWNYVGKFAEFGLTGLFFLIVGRKLGPKGYGSYNLMMTFVSSLVVILSFGFEMAMVRFVPECSAKGKDLEGIRLFKKLLLIRAVVYFIASAALFLLSDFVGSKLGEKEFLNLRGLLSLLLIGFGLRDLINSYYFAVLKIKDLSIIKIVAQSTGVILVAVLFYNMQPRLDYALYCFTFSVIIFVVLAYSGINRISKGYECKDGNENTGIKSIIRFSVFTWLTSIFTFFLSGQINVLALGYLLKDPEKIGFYSSAIMIGYLPGVFISGMAGIFLPALTRALASGGTDSFRKTINGLAKLLIALLAPVIIFLGAYPGRVITTLLGEKFFPSASLFRVYAVFSLFNVLLLTHVTYNSLYAVRQERKVLYIRMISGAINVGLLFLLIPVFGPLGAVIAVSMALFVQQILEFSLLRKTVTGFYPLTFAVKTIIAALAGVSCVYFIHLRDKIGLILVGMVFAVVVVIFYKILKLFSMEDKERFIGLHPKAKYFSWLI
ncbi:MAG: hypothetical protein A2231_07145 [Candidatus Firestonebacteria bacterium RIFOXYA2_FULL_40_8]|nr:MAG: hypothetical protein A2231_07145 [Candidatus Firestonebacteria bacterium RIFOXYA2_FULL_40_8]